MSSRALKRGVCLATVGIVALLLISGETAPPRTIETRPPPLTTASAESAAVDTTDAATTATTAEDGAAAHETTTFQRRVATAVAGQLGTVRDLEGVQASASNVRFGADVDLAFAIGKQRSEALRKGLRTVVEGKDRTPSFPFVTGDGFRAVCSVVIDETTRSLLGDRSRWESEPLLRNLAALPANASIFVKTELLDVFIASVLPLLKAPVVLVSHNSDYSAPWESGNVRAKNGVIGEYKQQRRVLLDNPLISVWYAQNAVIEHPKLVPLPIGIENRYNKYGAHLAAYALGTVAARRRPHALRQTKPLVGFSVKTNPRERNAALEVARSRFSVSSAPAAVPKVKRGQDALAALRGYLRQLTESAFVFAPQGHGVDTHRLWEALYMGASAVTTPAPLLTSPSRVHSDLLNRRVFVVANGWAALTPEGLEAFAKRSFAVDTEFDAVLDMNWWALEVNRHQPR